MPNAKPSAKFLFTGTRVGSPEGSPVGFVRRFADMLVARVAESDIEVVDLTFADATAAALRDRWRDDVLFHQPDVLVLLVGEKDMFNLHYNGDRNGTPEAFEAALAEILDATTSQLPGCRIVLMQPYVALLDRNPHAGGAIIALFERYLAAVQRLADRHALPLVRCHERITELMTEHRDPDLFGGNPVQLNDRGNLLLADMLRETLGIGSPETPTVLRPGETVLFFGDSITDAGRRGEHLPLGDGFVRIFDGLSFAREPDKRIRVVNKGIGGNTVVDLLHRWELDVIPHEPDRLVILVGINDLGRSRQGGEPDTNPALFRETYGEMLRQILGACPEIELVLMSPFYMSSGGLPGSDRQETLARIPEYVAAVADLAMQYGARFIDLHAAFQSRLKWCHNLRLGREPVHPHQTGHMLIAEVLHAGMRPDARLP